MRARKHLIWQHVHVRIGVVPGGLDRDLGVVSSRRRLHTETSVQ